MEKTRRNLIKFGLASPFVSLLPSLSFGQSEKKQFHVSIILNAGADCSYLFDARPREFTKHGHIQNYNPIGDEPYLWEGKNGHSCYAGPATKPLKRFKDNFSVINGVHMASSFAGHEQNLNYLLTGNPFGGDCYIPILNKYTNNTSIDYVNFSSFMSANIKNSSKSIFFGPSSASGIQKSLENFKVLSNDPVSSYINSMYKSALESGFSIAKGASQFLEAKEGANDLLKKVQNTEIRNISDDFDAKIDMLFSYFSGGISNNALIFLDSDDSTFDTHSAEDAKRQPEIFKDIVEKIIIFLGKLYDTPFNGSRWADYITYTITSEFSRTTKQSGKAIDETGTDHNPLNNSIIVGGSGIKGGNVFGSSDLDSLDLDGKLVNISKVHRKYDAENLQCMGKPFDFDTCRPRNDLPDVYKGEDYISYSSFINTIYALYGIDKSHFRKTSNARGSSEARIISKLIS